MIFNTKMIFKSVDGIRFKFTINGYPCINVLDLQDKLTDYVYPLSDKCFDSFMELRDRLFPKKYICITDIFNELTVTDKESGYFLIFLKNIFKDYVSRYKAGIRN